MKIKKKEVHKSVSWNETINFRTKIYLKVSQIGNIIKVLEKKGIDADCLTETKKDFIKIGKY